MNKKRNIAAGLFAGLFFASIGSAQAQEFKFKTFSPGIKSTAGFLSASRQNSPETVSQGAFSLPTAQLTIPGAFRGDTQELQIDVYALGQRVSPTNVSTSQITGNAPLVVKSENCTGATLTEGQFCSVVLAVQNEAGRGSNTGQVQIQGTDAGGRSISGAARLSWSVLAPMSAQSTGSLSFPDVEVGALSAPQFFRVEVVSAPLTISSLSAPAGFELSSVNCLTASGTVNSLPVVIRPKTSGDYCEFGVTFKPTASISYNTAMVVNDDDEGYQVEVNLVGKGVSPKSYATWLNRGRQTQDLSISTDGLTLTKTSSWNNSVRLVGSKLLDSGKYYIEFNNNLPMSQFGMTPGISVSETTPSDRGFNLTTSGLTSFVGSFGMLIDMDARTIQAVNSSCAVSSASVALAGTGGQTPYAIYPAGTGSRGLTSSVNFGQYAMRCSFPGYQNGWFTQQ